MCSCLSSQVINSPRDVTICIGLASKHAQSPRPVTPRTFSRSHPGKAASPRPQRARTRSNCTPATDLTRYDRLPVAFSLRRPSWHLKRVGHHHTLETPQCIRGTDHHLPKNNYSSGSWCNTTLLWDSPATGNSVRPAPHRHHHLSSTPPIYIRDSVLNSLVGAYPS